VVFLTANITVVAKHILLTFIIILAKFGREGIGRNFPLNKHRDACAVLKNVGLEARKFVERWSQEVFIGEILHEDFGKYYLVLNANEKGH